MINKLFSCFNIGTINQTNINNYNAGIKTQLIQIKRTFDEGKIKIAFNDLCEAKNEAKNNPAATYDFLILELQFYITLKDFEKIESITNYLKKNFNKFLDLKFYEVEATLFSFKNDIENFTKVIEKMKFEFSSKISEKYIEILFLLNSHQIEIAKQKYENHIQNPENRDNNLDFIGGIIYSELFFKNLDKKDFVKAQEIYESLLSIAKLSLYDKIEIYSKITFYHTLLLYNGLKPDKNFKTDIETTLNLLNIIVNDLNYFDKSLRSNLINCLLHCYWINEQKNEFISTYETFNDSEMNLMNYMIYNLHFKNSTDDIDYNKIETYILKKHQPEFITYIDELYKLEKFSRIISFINKNKTYLNNEIVIAIYCDAHLNLNKKITDEDLAIVFENQDNSLISYLTFLEVLRKNNKEQIKPEMVEKLHSYFKDGIEEEILIIKSLDIFIETNLKYFFDLLLNCCDNDSIVREGLKFINKNKNVYLLDVEKVLEKINVNEHLNIIGNIYEKFGLLSKAYSFYQKIWKPEDNYIQFTSAILTNCSLRYFMENQGAIINEKQDKIYVNFLIEHIEQLDLQELIILSSFMIIVQKLYSDGFYFLNKKLLTLDVTTLDNEIKDSLSKLYFYTITYEKSNYLHEGLNLAINQAGKFYLPEEKYSDVNSIYNFELLEQIKFKLLSKDKKNIKELSCFHIICNQFLQTMKSKHFTSIQGSSEDLLKSIEEITLEQYRNNKDNIESYSNGEIISFYNLSNHLYDTYFTLIPALYDDDSINFDAGNVNPTPDDIKKLLTLSSIIFIDHMGKLDYILSKKEMYIQQTTVDYLLSFVERLNGKKEIMTVYNDGIQLKSKIKNQKEIEKDEEYLIYLATKITEHCRIVNDRELTIHIADSEKILAPLIGRLEYKAIAAATEGNYQIITEDRIISFLFNELNFNTNMVSNSSFLLIEDIKPDKFDELGEYLLKLHNKKYKYLFNKVNSIEKLRESIFRNSNFTLIKGYEGKLFKTMITIAYSYGWMEEFERYYESHYEFKVGMKEIPKKDFIAKNIEYIREVSNYFNEKEFAENKATESFKLAQQEVYRKNQRVIVSENDGYIYEKISLHEKKMIKKTNKKIPVDMTKTVDLS